MLTPITGFGDVATAVGGEVPEGIGQKYGRTGDKRRGERHSE